MTTNDPRRFRVAGAATPPNDRIDKPFLDSVGRRLENFTRVETFGDNARKFPTAVDDDNNVHWLKLFVDPESREVFSYQPQMVPENRVAVPAPLPALLYRRRRMKMTNRRWISAGGGFAFLLVFAWTLFGQTAAKPVFVSAEQLDVAAVLPNPPASGSKQIAVEMAELHQLQDTRTAAQIERAKNEDVQEDIFIFRDVLGEKFRREDLPLTALLSDHVHSNEGVIVNPAKKFFHRQRPYLFDPTLQPVCKMKTDPTDYAYPSGHGTSGYLEALVLVMIAPEKRDAILARADDYAHNRLVCGVHYASDIVASKSVAYAAIGLMMDNSQFRKELEAAKTETRHALGL